ncbi:hydroxyethylthiazole kinase [Clostridiaceae bacterium M8S5]|nr:hydroxyethylthiazole kinase [Clostridiaceae bacterium M8S5]
MYKDIFMNVRVKSPLVHCITNYVTVNDCANVILGCGGSPIMADDISEVEEITSICNSLDINIGTLNVRTIKSMIAAGKRSNQLSHPVVLDPVGTGASILRTSTTFKLLEEIKFDVIRGNISEIKTISQGSGNTKGVDADVSDIVTEDNIDEVISFSKELSKKTGAIIVITGVIDIVSDSKESYIVRNGHTMMSKITGTGCMLTALIATYCGANKDNILKATALAVGVMGLSGELAHKKVIDNNGGTSSYRMFLIDEISKMEFKSLEGGLKIESR